uniref:Uncharacterized protein n=1 Tax=Solanum tuberosum TaxID=4113 RepID=M1AKD3_SOLTU
MATEGDVNAASTTNVRSDGGRKSRKGKKHQKSNEEMLLEPTQSEALTSQPPSTTETSDDERGEEPIDVTAGKEWVARVEVARQAVEILGRRMNVADGKFKTLEDFTLEETENIRKELERRQWAEFKMKEAITSLECRLMENYTEKKAQTTKGDGCYICGGPHGYAICPKMKNLGAILRERKENDAQEQGQNAGTTQLGMVGLCKAIAKQIESQETSAHRVLPALPYDDRPLPPMTHGHGAGRVVHGTFN